MSKNAKPDMKAFVVTKSGDKSFYHEIGAAWKNKTGGYGIKLHALPPSGEILLLPPKDKDES